jgi:hypothetical protein
MVPVPPPSDGVGLAARARGRVTAATAQPASIIF